MVIFNNTLWYCLVKFYCYYKGYVIYKQKCFTLKQKIEKHFESLKIKYTITPILYDDLLCLIEMEEDERVYCLWFSCQRSFIYDIEKEIKKLES